jgi:hypothetical protein
MAASISAIAAKVPLSQVMSMPAVIGGAEGRDPIALTVFASVDGAPPPYSLSHRRPVISGAKPSPKAVRLAQLGQWKAAKGREQSVFLGGVTATSNSLISQCRHRSSKPYYGFLDSELFDSLSRFANCLWATACREMWGSVPPPSRLHGSPATAPQVGHGTSKTLLCMTKGYCSLHLTS